MKDAQQLRQKAIGVLYIISLLLFFLFYSIDYSDGLSLADKRVRQQQQGVDSILSIAIRDIAGDTTALRNAVFRERFYRFERQYRLVNAAIDSARRALGNGSGINAYGYLKRGASREPGKHLLLDGGFFDSLLRQIHALDQMVVEVGETPATPVDSLIVDRKGRTVRAAAFYFDHSPLNAAMLYLTSFKSSIMLDRIRYYRAIYTLHEATPPADTSTAKPDEEDIRQVRAATPVTGHNETMLRNVGEPVTIPITRFQGESSDVTALVTKNNKVVGNYRIKDSVFRFSPETPGNYRLTITDPENYTQRYVDLIVPPPMLIPEAEETIYLGQDNKFKLLNPPSGDVRRKIYYTVTGDAEVYSRDSSVFVRPSKRGRLIVRAYAGSAKDSGSLLYKRELVARELALPKAQLRFNGQNGEASVDQITKNSALYASSEEPAIVEDVYVSDFDLFIIPDVTRQFSVYLHNEGGTFTGRVSQAFSKLKPGNIIVFTNINTKSTQGIQRQAQPLTVKIK